MKHGQDLTWSAGRRAAYRIRTNEPPKASRARTTRANEPPKTSATRKPHASTSLRLLASLEVGPRLPSRARKIRTHEYLKDSRTCKTRANEPPKTSRTRKTHASASLES